MSVQLAYRTALTVLETITAGVADVVAAASQIRHDQFNTSYDLSSSSSVPVTQVSSQVLALVAGTKTLDLTALPGANGVTIDGTGLKVRAVKLKGITAMAAITITAGASLGYNLFGSGWKVIVNADQEAVFFLGNNAPTITSGLKNIDFAGTGTNTINVEIVLG
jgi:hypothetical protein